MPHLDVTGGHRIYYEVHGPADGRPAVLLHGGPGGGFRRGSLKAFDLTKWRVVAFDQRGCGRSTPRLRLTHNTTWDLVADIEALRHHVFKVAGPWTVFGGSWGSTLALAYWSRHPEAVAAMVLRGICLMSAWEQEWLYSENGAARIAPEAWTDFARGGRLSHRTTASRTIRRYRTLFRSRNRATRRRAVSAWYQWEDRLSRLRPVVIKSTPAEREELSVLEAHYFHHDAWLRPGELLAAARRIPPSVPVTIVQGRYDLVCPAASAVELHGAIPHSKLHIVADAGHASTEPGIAAGLKAATDELLTKKMPAVPAQ
jgi:proline iminopeptidase